MSSREIVARAFDAWASGTGYVSEIFSEAMTWGIVGESATARRYPTSRAFVEQVLTPFGQRFSSDDPFRPVNIRGVLADGDSVVVVWDGAGTTTAGTTYANTYAWFMRLEDGQVVDGVAFFDSVAFNRLWHDDIAPA